MLLTLARYAGHVGAPHIYTCKVGVHWASTVPFQLLQTESQLHCHAAWTLMSPEALTVHLFGAQAPCQAGNVRPHVAIMLAPYGGCSPPAARVFPSPDVSRTSHFSASFPTGLLSTGMCL